MALPTDVMVIANFSDTNYTDYGLFFPIDGTWYEVLNSQAGVYGGNGWGNGGSVWVSGGWANIVIPQWSLLVLRHENPRGRNPDLDTDGDVDLRDYGILQQRIGNTGCWMSADVHENGRVDQADRQVMAASLTGPGYDGRESGRSPIRKVSRLLKKPGRRPTPPIHTGGKPAPHKKGGLLQQAVSAVAGSARAAAVFSHSKTGSPAIRSSRSPGAVARFACHRSLPTTLDRVGGSSLLKTMLPD